MRPFMAQDRLIGPGHDGKGQRIGRRPGRGQHHGDLRAEMIREKCVKPLRQAVGAIGRGAPAARLGKGHDHCGQDARDIVAEQVNLHWGNPSSSEDRPWSVVGAPAGRRPVALCEASGPAAYGTPGLRRPAIREWACSGSLAVGADADQGRLLAECPPGEPDTLCRKRCGAKPGPSRSVITQGMRATGPPAAAAPFLIRRLTQPPFMGIP